MTSFVRIALAGAGSFAKMEIRAGDDIADVADRACAEFSHWGANAGQIALYLVDAVGDDLPPPSAVDSARHLDQIGWSLTRAGVSSGAWLVARKIADGGATKRVTRARFFFRFSNSDTLAYPSTEQMPMGACTPLSADLICCLPTPLAMWLSRHSKRRIIGSLLLFCVWETLSSLLLQEWKTWGFPALGLLLTSLGFWMDDSRSTATWVATSLVACSILGWTAVKVGGGVL
jgi:hypothetical protein